jgi:Zn-dependent protease
LLHEIGHILAMAICKNPVRKIVFYGMGIKINGANPDNLTYENDFIILFAGIFVNCIAAIISFLSKVDHLIIFAQINLLVATFNLFPFDIFDGGRIRELFIYRYFEYIKAQKILKVLKHIDIITFIIVLLAIFTSGIKNPWIYGGVLFFLLMGMLDVKSNE